MVQKFKQLLGPFATLWRTRFLLFLYKNNSNRKLLFSGLKSVLVIKSRIQSDYLRLAELNIWKPETSVSRFMENTVSSVPVQKQ